VAVLLALALLVTAGPAVPSTTTSCGMAYIPSFETFRKDSTFYCNVHFNISNITDDVVHIKITLYYQSGVIEKTWEADIAPHASYLVGYVGSDHPYDPHPVYYGTVEWTAQFCTQKALIANAFAEEYVTPANYSYHARAIRAIPINGGLPF